MKNDKHIIKNINELFVASNDVTYVSPHTFPNNTSRSSSQVSPTSSLPSKRVASVSVTYRLNHCFEGVNPAHRKLPLVTSTSLFQHSNSCNEHGNPSKIISGEMIKFNQAQGGYSALNLFKAQNNYFF